MRACADWGTQRSTVFSACWAEAAPGRVAGHQLTKCPSHWGRGAVGPERSFSTRSSRSLCSSHRSLAELRCFSHRIWTWSRASPGTCFSAELNLKSGKNKICFSLGPNFVHISVSNLRLVKTLSSIYLAQVQGFKACYCRLEHVLLK